MNGSHVASWVRALAWLVIAAIAAMFVARIHYTLLLFGVSAGLAYLLYPWVRWVHEGKLPLLGRPVSWTAAVAMVFATLPVLMGCALYFAVPLVTQQVETITNNMPQQVDKMQRAAFYWQARFDRAQLPQKVRQHVQNMLDQGVTRLGDSMGNIVSGMTNFLLGAAWWIMFGLMALFISMFMLLYMPTMAGPFYDAVPDAYRADVQQLADEINLIFGGFVKGTAILSLISGTVVFLLLTTVLTIASWAGVPGFTPFQYSLVMGLVAVVTYPIPIVGLVVLGIVGGVLAYLDNGGFMYVLTVMAISGTTALSVDRFVSPRLMSNAMGVSPLFVMFAAVAGAEFMGFWGMLLGVPVAAALKLVFRWVRIRFLVPLPSSAEIGGAPRVAALEPVTRVEQVEEALRSASS